MVILFGLLIAMAALAGCTRQAPQQPVPVQTIDPAGYQEMLRRQRPRGAGRFLGHLVRPLQGTVSPRGRVGAGDWPGGGCGSFP